MKLFDDTLFVIPARGGSKGLPGKNIKLLNGKPLIHYSIDFARLFVADKNICVTTDSKEIAECVEKINYKTLFLRPEKLATDEAGSGEVLLHAIGEYEKRTGNYERIVLLQPTSPFRLKQHLNEASSLYNSTIDMVVSVRESEANPYYNIFEEGEDGFLKKSKDGHYSKRQDCPSVYQYNGSIYIINASSLKKRPLNEFEKIVKYIMPAEYSIDLDTPYDWTVAECLTDKIDYYGR